MARFRIPLLVVSASLALTACLSTDRAPPGRTGSTAVGSASGTATRAGAAPSPARSSVAPVPIPPPGLNAWQLAGQRVIYSYPGLEPPERLLQIIRSGAAAGVVFFSENIASTDQISSVVARLRQAQAQSPVHLPLLLMVDQEGGQVRRLPGGPDLSEKWIGQATDPVAAAGAAGAVAGRTLTAVGMNVNLAPVLDVYAAAGNFIDQYQRSYSADPGAVTGLGRAFIAAQQRSFGATPGAVADLGRAFIAAQQHAGVAATAKHFPGLGWAATAQNTDTGPVTLYESLDRLRGTDEAPYSAAVAAGVDLIMLSWATYPALDRDHPAGLSPAIVGGELRGRLGFTGVTVTDALEAGALAGYGGTGQRAVDAAVAGMDLMLCSVRDVSQGEAATAALAAAYGDGRLDRAGFVAAVDRITALRAGLG